MPSLKHPGTTNVVWMAIKRPRGRRSPLLIPYSQNPPYRRPLLNPEVSWIRPGTTHQSIQGFERRRVSLPPPKPIRRFSCLPTARSTPERPYPNGWDAQITAVTVSGLNTECHSEGKASLRRYDLGDPPKPRSKPRLLVRSITRHQKRREGPSGPFPTPLFFRRLRSNHPFFSSTIHSSDIQAQARPHHSTWNQLQAHYQSKGTVVPSRGGGIHYKFHTGRRNSDANRSQQRKKEKDQNGEPLRSVLELDASISRMCTRLVSSW